MRSPLEITSLRPIPRMLIGSAIWQYRIRVSATFYGIRATCWRRRRATRPRPVFTLALLKFIPKMRVYSAVSRYRYQGFAKLGEKAGGSPGKMAPEHAKKDF